MSFKAKYLHPFFDGKWLSNPKLEGASHLATTVAVIVGVTAIYWQSSQYAEQVAIQRELAISDRWQDHIRLSLQHPKFAAADLDPSKLDELDQERYIWFVEDMIFSSERILQYAPKDPQWINTVIYEMRIKRPYIVSNDFLGCPKEETISISNCSTNREGDDSSSYCTYVPELRKIIRQAFRRDAPAMKRLSFAESRCHWDMPTRTVGVQPNA